MMYKGSQQSTNEKTVEKSRQPAPWRLLPGDSGSWLPKLELLPPNKRDFSVGGSRRISVPCGRMEVPGAKIYTGINIWLHIDWQIGTYCSSVYIIDCRINVDQHKTTWDNDSTEYEEHVRLRNDVHIKTLLKRDVFQDEFIPSERWQTSQNDTHCPCCGNEPYSFIKYYHGLRLPQSNQLLLTIRQLQCRITQIMKRM